MCNIQLKAESFDRIYFLYIVVFVFDQLKRSNHYPFMLETQEEHFWVVRNNLNKTIALCFLFDNLFSIDLQVLVSTSNLLEVRHISMLKAKKN